VWTLPLVASLAVFACEKDEPKPAQYDEDAGVAKPPVDPNLAAAVAAASAKPPGQSQPDGGPPPNGIFAPGAADKEIPKGATPKLTLGAAGSEPRQSLKLVPAPGNKATGSITLTVQNDPRQPGLPIEFSVVFEARKAKAAPEPGEQAPAAVEVVVQVKDAKLALVGRAPAETERQVSQLKGSKLRYDVLPNGAGRAYDHEAPKNLGREFKDILGALGEALATLTLPAPDDKLGPGAFWMVTSRDGVWGLDLVTYRIIRLESATAEGVTLSVDAKRYATNTDFNPPSLVTDSKLTLEQFDSIAKGEARYATGSAFPTSAQVEMVMAAGLSVAGAPDQRASVQSQTLVKLSLAKP
jgi:hypothetical protein